MKKIKLFPAVMTILSALYFVSVLMSEDFKYDVDTVGGDPGGKLLPLLMAGFLFLGFLFITIKERPDGNKTDKETLKLFFITLGLSVLYIVLHKTVGFVILSVLLMYPILYLYTTIGEERKPVQAAVGGICTLFLTIGVYSISRKITKLVIKLGRNGSLPKFFGKSSGAAVVAILFITVVLVALCLTLVKYLKKKGFSRVATSSIVSFSTVLYLYVIFKQFFMVTLAPGLLNF